MTMLDAPTQRQEKALRNPLAADTWSVLTRALIESEEGEESTSYDPRTGFEARLSFDYPNRRVVVEVWATEESRYRWSDVDDLAALHPGVGYKLDDHEDRVIVALVPGAVCGEVREAGR